jgi:hypothetical protein
MFGRKLEKKARKPHDWCFGIVAGAGTPLSVKTPHDSA